MFFDFQAPRTDGEGLRHFWRYVDVGDFSVEDNRFEIARRIACRRDEPRYIGDPDVFDLQERVIAHILATEGELEARAAAPPVVEPIQHVVAEAIEGALRRRTVEREKANRARRFLVEPMGRALHEKLKAADDAWA